MLAWQEIKRRGLYGSTIWAVSRELVPQKQLASEGTSKREIQILKTRFASGKLSVINETSTQNTADFATKIPANTAIHLSLTGSAVLFKAVEQVQDAKQALALAFPNLNTDLFYYQVQLLPSVAWVFIARRAEVDTLVQNFKKHKLFVVSLQLSHAYFPLLKEYLKTEDHTLQSLTASWDMQTNALNRNTETATASPLQKKSYTFGDGNISSHHTLGLASVIAHLSDSDTMLFSNTDTATFTQDYEHQKRFSWLLKYGIGALLAVLLLNFYFFSKAHTRLSHLQGSTLQTPTVQNASQLKERQQVFERKAQSVQNRLQTTGSKTSWYLTELTRSLPTSIKLTELQFQPLKAALKEDQPLQVTSNQILLKAEAQCKTEVNTWLQTLERLPFVTQVVVLAYSHSQKQRASLELQVQIKQRENTPSISVNAPTF